MFSVSVTFGHLCPALSRNKNMHVKVFFFSPCYKVSTYIFEMQCRKLVCIWTSTFRSDFFIFDLFQSGGKGKLVRSLAVCEESCPRMDTEIDNQVSKLVAISCMVNLQLHDYMVYLGLKVFLDFGKPKSPYTRVLLLFMKFSGF